MLFEGMNGQSWLQRLGARTLVPSFKFSAEWPRVTPSAKKVSGKRQATTHQLWSNRAFPRPIGDIEKKVFF